MAKKISPLLPETDQLLVDWGDRIRLARLRRKLSAKEVATQGGVTPMTPMTLRAVERGGSGVTIGAYASVLQVLGLDEDLSAVEEADPVGRALQDSPSA